MSSDDLTRMTGIPARAWLEIERQIVGPIRMEITRLEERVKDQEKETQTQYQLHSETRAKLNELVGRVDSSIGKVDARKGEQQLPQPNPNEDPVRQGLAKLLYAMAGAVTLIATAVAAFFGMA